LLVIENPFQLGEGIHHRGILILPFFPRHDPLVPYITLEEALQKGLSVREVSDAGLVPELLVENPLSEDVLLYDGEELVGAKQNRILNISVLVGAGSTLPIPVSCVEEGRWQSQRSLFTAASHASHPSLRRRKAEALHSGPLTRGIAQGDVWEEVALTADRFAVSSNTHANADTFRAHRPALAELEEAFPLQPGQCGAVLVLGDDLCLDAVSRPDVFSQLWPKLRAGYLLDALDRLDRPSPSVETAGAFIAALSSAVRTRGPSAGRGVDIRLRGDAVIGSGLELDGELLQLCAFRSENGDRSSIRRIARPSRRRHV
jgi:hypothetical protein